MGGLRDERSGGKVGENSFTEAGRENIMKVFGSEHRISSPLVRFQQNRSTEDEASLSVLVAQTVEAHCVQYSTTQFIPLSKVSVNSS